MKIFALLCSCIVTIGLVACGPSADRFDEDRYLNTTNDDDYIPPNPLVNTATASTRDNTVDIGDTAVIPMWKWVQVQNSNSIESGNNEFLFGDTCGVDMGYVIRVKAIDGNDVLVEYELPYLAFGSSCPGGTLFFVEKQTFLQLTGLYLAVRSEIDEGK